MFLILISGTVNINLLIAETEMANRKSNFQGECAVLNTVHFNWVNVIAIISSL